MKAVPKIKKQQKYLDIILYRESGFRYYTLDQKEHLCKTPEEVHEFLK